MYDYVFQCDVLGSKKGKIEIGSAPIEKITFDHGQNFLNFFEGIGQ